MPQNTSGYDHPHPLYKKGDRVRVTAGPHAGKLGTIAESVTCPICAKRLIDGVK